MTERNKHIDIKCHHVKFLVIAVLIHLYCVKLEDQPADILTNIVTVVALFRLCYLYDVYRLGILSLSLRDRLQRNNERFFFTSKRAVSNIFRRFILNRSSSGPVPEASHPFFGNFSEFTGGSLEISIS